MRLKDKKLQHHWDSVYQNNKTEELGWFEHAPSIMLEFIEKISLPQHARIFIAGAGSTNLVDTLDDLSYTNIIASDISEQGLEKLRSRLGLKRSRNITWIQDDLLYPVHLKKIEPVDLWIDRAVLHFFTEEIEQEKYFKLLDTITKVGGYVIIAVFNLDGAAKCSGLDVTRYDGDKIAQMLGSDYRLLTALDYDYIMPSQQVRPYVYTLFQKVPKN